MRFQIETTDTFGGEANYSWVERNTFEVPENASEMAIVRKAKKTQGITARHTKTSFGDEIWLDYPGLCVRSFISWIDDTLI